MLLTKRKPKEWICYSCVKISKFIRAEICSKIKVMKIFFLSFSLSLLSSLHLCPFPSSLPPFLPAFLSQFINDQKAQLLHIKMRINYEERKKMHNVHVYNAYTFFIKTTRPWFHRSQFWKCTKYYTRTLNQSTIK